jgi:hypothetical protein
MAVFHVICPSLRPYKRRSPASLYIPRDSIVGACQTLRFPQCMFQSCNLLRCIGVSVVSMSSAMDSTCQLDFFVTEHWNAPFIKEGYVILMEFQPHAVFECNGFCCCECWFEHLLNTYDNATLLHLPPGSASNLEDAVN